MDRLGFVKTIEVALAALLLISLYTSLQATVFSQSEEVKRSLNQQLTDFLDYLDKSGELRNVLNNYDFLRLESLLKNLFFSNVNYYFEPQYMSRLYVDSLTAKNENISFIYHFPSGIDKNSIKIIKDYYELPAKALFDWYRIPIVFNQEVNDEYVTINLTLPSFANNKTLKFYINSVENSIDLEGWLVCGSVINVSAIVHVPEINDKEKGYLYFATNQSSTIVTYESLTSTLDPDITVYDYEFSETAEVLLTAQLTQGTNLFYLQHSLFSSLDSTYDEIININNTGLIISPSNNDIKDYSTTPLLALKKTGSIVNWLMPVNEGFVILNLYGELL